MKENFFKTLYQMGFSEERNLDTINMYDYYLCGFKEVRVTYVEDVPWCIKIEAFIMLNETKYGVSKAVVFIDMEAEMDLMNMSMEEWVKATLKKYYDEVLQYAIKRNYEN